MTWLDNLVEQHKDFESPVNFYRWAGLAAISAVLKDSVYMDRYIYKIYPNIYVMFHAESGLKKGPAVAMATKLVQLVGNTTVIKGRSSVQAILKEMGTVTSKPGGGMQANSSVFIASSEMSSSLVEDPVAAKILTDLYDRNYNEGEWKSLLKQETFKLTNPTITMLGATNEAMSEDFFTGAVIKGGYFARTCIIYESKRNKRNSLAYQPSFIPDYNEAAKYLKELAQLKGPFKYFSSIVEDEYYCIKHTIEGRDHYFCEAGDIYHRWYDEFLDTVDSQDVKDETGTLNRFGDTVVKISMLLSLAEHPKLEITAKAMNESIRICEQLLGNVRRTTMAKNGLSTSSNLKALIINELLNNRADHKISRAMLTKKFYMHYGSVEELNHIMESFDVAGMIKTETIGTETIYKMPESQVVQLKEFLSGKGNRR
jgi:hypothetical protein